MKKYINLYLLLTLALTPISLMLAQTDYEVVSTRRSVYSDPKVHEAIDFIKNRLPQLVVENKEQAIQEYMIHSESLNQLDELDVLYLVGHFYAVVDEASTAIPYFDLLINDMRLGEDARRMLNLLLYYRAVDYLKGEDEQEAREFLEDVLNLFPTGRYYPTYLFLWADLISESEQHSGVTNYVENYNANRVWIHQQFKPRRTAIVERIKTLDFEPYYQNPTRAEYYVLETEINSIQADLETLYNELRAIPGFVTTESLDRIATEEMDLLQELKKQLESYSLPPPLDLELLANTDYMDTDMLGYSKYREGAILLQQLKGTAEYYGIVLDIMDRIFEQRYELFVNEDPSVVGKGFSDMEMKRLFDIERNIDLYTEVIEAIDEVMADPEYNALNIDLRPERQEYVEKLADIQNRKERYLSFRKHLDSLEESIFNELLEEYYALNREKNTFDRLLPEIEEVMIVMIKENYPREQQRIINGQLALASNVTSGNFSTDQSLNSFMTNLDFIHLQLDYRNLRYREQQRKAKAGTISEDEMQRLYDEIVAEKSDLLRRHQDFVADNPGFKALEQPSGGYLLNNAIVHYNMAELQYAVDLDNPERALAYYRKVLDIDPDFFLMDYTLYNIGYLSSEIVRDSLDVQIVAYRTENPNQDRPDNLKYNAAYFTEATDAFTELVSSERFADSPLYDEAVYRLGLLNFLIGSDAAEPILYYTRAIALFDELVEDPESEYTYEALYQRGWVRMNQGDEAALKQAIGDFVTLMQAVDMEVVDNPYLATDYKGNAIDNIAYSLVALDGVDFNTEAQGVSEIQVALADYEDTSVKTSILDKAAKLKADMLAPMQAIDFLNLRLQTTPMALVNPTIVDSIITLYHTPGIQIRSQEDLATIRAQHYRDIKDDYNNESEWYKRNIEGQDLGQQAIQEQLGVIKTAYEAIRVNKYNAVIASPSGEALENYKEHIREFASYRELFGAEYQQWMKDNDKTETQLATVIAEGNENPADYMRAIHSLWDFNNRNPGNPDFFNNEGLAYKYVQEVYENLNANLANSEDQTASDLPGNQSKLYTLFRDGTLRFYDVLNSSEYANPANQEIATEVMMNLAAIEVERGMSSEAKAHYHSLLENGEALDDSDRRSIYLNLANIEEASQNYAEAENWYRQALSYATDAQDARNIDQQVKMQIQNRFEEAEQRGDYDQAASGYIRLSNEVTGESDKYQGYRYQASEAYKKAASYQESIDLKLELAEAKNKMEEKYFLYYESWTIADSLMNDQTQTRKLKNDFISMYPQSKLAFNLRVEAIEEMKADPGRRETAAEMYIALHDEVRAGDIDSGDVDPEDIYLWAIDIYREEENQDKIVELLTYFTQTYPDHEMNVTFLTLLADEYLARGDEEKFEYYSRQIYLKDNTRSERYLTTAQQNLGRIAMEFDEAFTEKDWDLVFDKIDEFKQLEARYENEGLTMDNSQAYEAFAYAEAEYEELQARLAFLRDFDRQIDNIENNGFLSKTPNQLVMVNYLTTWRRHLFGGEPNRVPGLKDQVDNESNRIIRLLEQPGSQYLDNTRRLEALVLIARINDHAAQVIQTQISKYINISNEMHPYRDRNQFSQAQYNDLVDNQLLPYAQGFIEQYNAASTGIYLDIYNNYVLGGYTDKFTQKAEEVLRSRNQLPEYQEEIVPLNSDWDAILLLPDGGNKKLDLALTTEVSPNGEELAKYTVQPGHTLTLQREFDFSAAPEFAFLQLAYPLDPIIYVNGEEVNLTYIPVDTLAIGNQEKTVRYAVKVNDGLWSQGANVFRGVFPNETEDPVVLYFNSSFYYDPDKLAESKTYETNKIYSNQDWTVIMTDEQGGETKTYAVASQSFDIPINRSEYLVNSAAQPIWTDESPNELVTEVAFEVRFQADAQFRNAYIDFVAPDNASVYLNNAEVSLNNPMIYDTDPFVVYPTRVEIPADLVIKGQNTLRIGIQNISPYRGMIAELSINKNVKE